VLLGRGLSDGLITRPEESYRLWCVVVCDLETSRMRRPWPTGGCRAKNKPTNPHRTTKGLGHITIRRSGVRSWCKIFERSKIVLGTSQSYCEMFSDRST